MIDQLASTLNVPATLLWTLYWWGVGGVALLTGLWMLVRHYRDYYANLKKYIEKDLMGSAPSGEIDGGQLVGAIVLMAIAGFCWPAGVVVGATAAIFLGAIHLGKAIVNLPSDIVHKKLVKEHKNKMLTSPNDYVRWLAEHHSKKKDDDQNHKG